MKVIWITNGPFSYHHTLLGKEIPVSASGTWLSAAYENVKKSNDVELHIATVSNIDKPLSGEFDNISFYIIPGGSIFEYDIISSNNRRHWERLKAAVNPDLMIVWGSEARFSYLAMQAFSDIPKVIFVQGVMNAIIGHLEDGIPQNVKRSTLRDYIDIFNFKKQSKRFIQQAIIEREMFRLAQGAIIENDWCASQCLSMNDKINIYTNQLPIRRVFFENKWSNEHMEPLSIFTNAGSVPYKGHHILFQALAIVKKSYPKVKLYIPGSNYLLDTKSLIHRTGYFNWLHNIYADNKLYENIIFVGTLSSTQMSDYIAKCNVYVMPSMVENHSSSLIEAMLMGAPCISSLVGGTASIVKHGINAFLYNSLEASTLAGYIIKLFADPYLCYQLSQNALTIRDLRKKAFGNEMKTIYNEILKQR